MKAFFRLFSTQIVKRHVPVISFPKRIAAEGIGLGWPPKNISSPSVTTTTTTSQTTPPAQSKPVGSSPRGSGIEFQLLPQRYRRSSLSQEEIDAINNGGVVL